MNSLRKISNYSDRIASLVERELRAIQKILRKRNRFNWPGLKMIDTLVDNVAHEILMSESSLWDGPIEEAWELRWAAASSLAIAAENARAILVSYSENYVKETRWYLKPFAQIERIACEKAIRYAFDDVERIYQEFKSMEFRS